MFCTSRNTFGVLGFSVTVQTQAGKFRYRLVPCLSRCSFKTGNIAEVQLKRQVEFELSV